MLREQIFPHVKRSFFRADFPSMIEEIFVSVIRGNEYIKRRIELIHNEFVEICKSFT